LDFYFFHKKKPPYKEGFLNLIFNYLLASQYKTPSTIIPVKPLPPREETSEEILSTTAVPINGTEGPKMMPRTTLSGIITNATSITPLRKLFAESIIA
jgi:hypothetical protein